MSAVQARTALPANAPIFAGIGARDTPAAELARLAEVSRLLAADGWSLRSGAAPGADQSCERGFMAGAMPGRHCRKEIVLPWEGFCCRSTRDEGCVIIENAAQHRKVVERLHPAPDRLGVGGWRLMVGNVGQILGPDLDLNRPVDAVLCWTEKGQAVGGTGFGMRLAVAWGIPVFNLGQSFLAGSGPAAVRNLIVSSMERIARERHD
jgi:hypothetical protein